MRSRVAAGAGSFEVFDGLNGFLKVGRVLRGRVDDGNLVE